MLHHPTPCNSWNLKGTPTPSAMSASSCCAPAQLWPGGAAPPCVPRHALAPHCQGPSSLSAAAASCSLSPAMAAACGLPATSLSAVRTTSLWSNARGGSSPTAYQRASLASSAALTPSSVVGTSAAYATVMVHPRGSRPGSPNAPTCDSSTCDEEGSTLVSSRSSRAAAASSVSPSSTNPPGSAHLSLNGSFLRLMSSSCAGWLGGCARMTQSTVTAGRGY
mmetsp:Transcript_35319/g.89409  ORF Transcript_35319/g.89409 Transcript_35319/m.89409 type:complete len:221 (+) Transcript_35319:214-876(+)